MVSEPASAEY